MNTITLQTVQIRTGNTPTWLYLEATTAPTPGFGHGTLWALVDLNEDINFGGPMTMFDPDSAFDEEYLESTTASGSLHFDCGCARELTYVLTKPGPGGTSTVKVGMDSAQAHACESHGFVYDPWQHMHDPVGQIEDSISAMELSCIRGAVQARRSGVYPMALAGVFGAAGMRPDEAHLAGTTALSSESMAAIAALRGQVMFEQSDPAWFRVR